jgi:hypothetical protein
MVDFVIVWDIGPQQPVPPVPPPGGKPPDHPYPYTDETGATARWMQYERLYAEYQRQLAAYPAKRHEWDSTWATTPPLARTLRADNLECTGRDARYRAVLPPNMYRLLPLAGRNVVLSQSPRVVAMKTETVWDHGPDPAASERAAWVAINGEGPVRVPTFSAAEAAERDPFRYSLTLRPGMKAANV